MTHHRGLSAVVGTVFLIAIVIGAMSYISYSLDVMGNFSESLISEESRQRDKQDEAFEISSIDITAANKLDGIIKNSGEIPIQLKTLYIDEQGINDVVQKFTLNTSISPGNTVNLKDLVDFDMDATKGYNMKVVSSRGEVNSFYVNSPSQQKLPMYLRTIPEYVPSEFTTTVLFSVVNNMSNNNVLYNVTPELNATTVLGNNVGNIRTGPIPTSYPVLYPGDVATFEYSVQLTGEQDDSVRFDATIANGVADNIVSTTAYVKEVTVATQAGTALESFGLSTELSNLLDILYFHDENTATPNGEYQMDGSDVTGTGTTGMLEDAVDFEFITSNVTATTTVLPGNWNITLAYHNELVPKGIPAPSFAFMMETPDGPGAGDIFDTTGNINKDFINYGAPTWNSNGGPDNKAYFSFDGNDDFRGDWDINKEYQAYTDIEGNAVTTAVWVRIPSTVDDTYMPIIRWGDEGDNASQDDDEYEISFGDYSAAAKGEFVYRYNTEPDSDQTLCRTDSAYDYNDDKWHFVVGARDGDDDCKLYVDGVLKDDIEDCNGCSGSSLVQVKDKEDIFIGHDGGSQWLIGDVAMVMHWNNVELNATTILDLNNTNYGLNATRAQITIEKTDGNGVSSGILYDQEFSFPYHDTSIRGDSENDRIDLQKADTDWKKYYAGNFTFSTGANTTFNTGERLKATIGWSGDSQNLPLHFRFDDEDPKFEQNNILTYFQTPASTPAWPTFLSFQRDEHVTYLVFNSGPNGAWFTYGGTRFVITTLDGTQSYGGIIESVNATSGGGPVDSTKDSIFIPDQNYAELKFYPLKNPPIASNGGGTKPDGGTYTASVFLSGFDDKGEVFLRTISLGVVNVEP